jgi:methenyltetrahydromethanopterin cyclohydrolase
VNPPAISINHEAMKIVRRILQAPAALGVSIERLPSGATVIDMGLHAPGGWVAARYYTLITLGGLGDVSYEPFRLGYRTLNAVRVMVDHPIEACVASQIAGWRLSAGAFAPILAGPGRALNRADPDKYFSLIDYRDQSIEGVVAIQTADPITDELAQSIAAACQIEPRDLYILVAPNSSLVCAVQVAARIVEQTLHRMQEEGFDLKQVVSACGFGVIPPQIDDELVSMGRINDSLLYGGEATIYVRGDDAALAALAPVIVSSNSRAYGKPFGQIFEEAGRDFYAIPLDLHSPAVVYLNNLTTGKTFHAGEINEAILTASFF